MAAPLYRPPTRVTSISIPFLAIVNRADPDRERYKHREPNLFEWSHRKYFWEDPYHVGAFVIPVKRVSLNYAGPTTFAQGDITGVGQDFVYTSLTNPTPGNLTTRTAAQMYADLPNPYPGIDYVLRLINIGGGSQVYLQPGAGVAIVGNPSINAGFFSDIQVYFTDASDAIMTVRTSNNPYNSSPH